jgi:hypothetical protein
MLLYLWAYKKSLTLTNLSENAVNNPTVKKSNKLSIQFTNN